MLAAYVTTLTTWTTRSFIIPRAIPTTREVGRRWDLTWV